ncbi:MAG: adenylate kinase family protein, partial [Candidatus Promineifilaceae bacterium]
TLAQAEALDELLADLGGKIDVVPSIEVPQDVLVERLLKRAILEGRADDNEETIRTRMQVYEDQTKPLLDYYGEKGLVVPVDGQQAIDEVQEDLAKVIDEATQPV